MGITLNPFTGQLDITGMTSVSGNTIMPYANFAAFPSVTTANNGQFGVALDTGTVYEVIGGVWTVVAGPADITSVGTIDSQTPSSDGAVDHANQLIMQSASATVPGLVNNTTQTFTGTKTFDNLIDSGLTASTALTANASKQLTSSSTTDTELGYVHGVTSAIQTQLNAKQSTTLTNTHLLVGNGSNVATDVAASGDLTLANTGAFTVAKIAGTTVSGTTGSTNVVFSNSPTLVTPALGTPSALVGTNITGTATSFTASNVTTNANLTGPITSVGNATSINSQTGTGNTFVMNTGPTMTNPIVGTQATSDASTKAASTAYVTTAVANAVAGVNPAMAVQAATAAASDTSGFTYNNGVSGIGATFTSGNNSAVTIDGFTFTTLGQRLLVKNDTQSPSGAFNGIYYVTTLQVGGVSPAILTRALDFDTPSDMNNTGSIPVVNGTTNGTTSWLLTSSITTVGTDPLTFTKFTRNPADYLLVANNLSDVASKSTSFNNLSPMTTSGDIIYGGASGTGTRLGANSTGTNEYLQSVSSGTPTWAQVAYADLSGSGSTNITTVGTVTTGTWSATTIALNKGGTGQTTKAAAFDALQPMTTGGDLIYGGASGTGTRLANGTAGQALLSAGTTLAPVWTSPQTTPTASTNAAWDANKNLSANNFLAGYTTTATAAGTTTLVVGSTQQQYFTGTTTQTLVLPVTSTLVLGFSYIVTNNSTGVVTVQSSGANNILAQGAGTTAIYTVILTSGTTAASWNYTYVGNGGFVTPTVQKFTSGSGTYTTPANVTYIKVRAVGAGGGGAGSSNNSNNNGVAGGTGGNTTFGSSLITSNGGTGGSGTTVLTGGSGGTATVSSPAIGTATIGGGGGSGQITVTSSESIGGIGGSSPLGGAGPGPTANGTAGNAGSANTGAGGSGASGSSGSSNQSGAGGGSGGYVDAIIPSPTTTYSYAIGAAGTAGTAGTGGQAGGAGAAGYIEVTEYYSNGAVGTATSITGSLITANCTVPTIQRFTSGSAQPYTTPTSPRTPLYLKVRMFGGGGGGGGSGVSPGAASNGTDTTFVGTTGSTSLTASKGNGAGSFAGGTGGTNTITSATDVNSAAGGSGQGGGQSTSSGTEVMGGQGASTPRSGGGSGAIGSGASGTAGSAANANSGAGGGGAGGNNQGTGQSGGGGGAGAYIEVIISSPVAGYTYTVGGGGNGGTAGTNGAAGGNGGSGYIVVEEFYQ